MKLSIFAFRITLTMIAGALLAPSAWADDIDIFLGAASGDAAAPNVMFLIDNDSNFAASNQKIPPIGVTGACPNPCPATGQSEVDAIVRVIAALHSSASHVNVGIAMLNSELGSPPSPLHSTACVSDAGKPVGDGNGTCNGGTYIRYGARDMADTTNFTALANILGWSSAPAPLSGSPNALSIYSNLNSPSEKINSSVKDSAESFYELFQYFESTPTVGLPAFGGVVTGSVNAYADFRNNNVFETPRGQGLAAPYALRNTGDLYVGPPNTTGCAKNYIIHIVNPDQSVGSIKLGHQQYAGSANHPDAFAATTGGLQSWVPAWTKFLRSREIKTYVVDVYKQSAPSSTFEAVAKNEASQGGGKYYVAQSGDDLLKDLTEILLEIQSVNSAFAATALPASASNRSVDLDQVYLGVFRPDASAGPRWFGNLKRYQIILNGGSPETGDAIGAAATNTNNGFISECAASYWTKDSSIYRPDGTTPTVADPAYWTNVPEPDGSRASQCTDPAAAGGDINPASTGNTNSSPQFRPPSGIAWQPRSDSPDGPFVEKGGAAEVLRRGNVDVATTDTWQVNRNIQTLNSAGTAVTTFDYTKAASDLGAAGVPAASVPKVADWVRGWDSQDEEANPNLASPYINPNNTPVTTTTETRPSIHGDVIHSTPLPITYNNSPGGVTVFYGSNDGMYHAVNANTGQEIWSFIAPEFMTRFKRLYDNSPKVAYPGIAMASIVPTPLKKDFFFDGSTGVYQAFDSSNRLTTAYIFPTMRRGGRMLYAFNVSPGSAGGNPPTTPTFLWKAGCPSMANDTGCTSGMSGIGQTWSTPEIGLIKDGPAGTATPMIVVGGGYDSTQATQTINGSPVVVRTSCEDENVRAPACSGRKGAAVYVIDAQGGPSTLLEARNLPAASGGSRAPGSVAGDVALLDFDGDGVIDYAYFADTTGSIYRLDFVDRTGGGAPVVGARGAWSVHRIAFTNDASNPRKFLFAPTLVLNQGPAAKALVYLALGSGDREHPISSQYPYSSPVQNRFYLFLDDPTTTGAAANVPLDLDNGTTTGSPAVNHSMESALGVSGGNPVFAECPSVAASASPPDTAHLGVTPSRFPTPSGWYMDLVQDQIDHVSPAPVNSFGHGGEQVVTPALIVGGQVTWGTNIPNPNVSNAACTNALGNAYGYLVDLLNGSPAIGTTDTCGGTAVANPYTNGGLPLPPTGGTVGVPGTGPNGEPTTTYVPICIGCPSKDPGGSAGTAAHDVTAASGKKRTRVYWFTPNYN